MRNKLSSRRGEMMVETLISMVIIVMTAMMLGAAVAVAMRGEAQAVRTTTFVNQETAAQYPDDSTTFDASLDSISLGKVKVKHANDYGDPEGLYCYEPSNET